MESRFEKLKVYAKKSRENPQSKRLAAARQQLLRNKVTHHTSPQEANPVEKTSTILEEAQVSRPPDCVCCRVSVVFYWDSYRDRRRKRDRFRGKAQNSQSP